MLLSALLLLGCATSAAYAAAQARAVRHELDAAGRALHRARHHLHERALLAELAAKLSQVDAVTEGVALGTDVVKAVHMGVASVPFGVLEAIPVTRPVTKVVRGVHDAVTHTVYGAIGLAGRALGLGVKAGLALRGGSPSASDTGKTKN